MSQFSRFGLEPDSTERSGSSLVVGKIGLWLLHAVMITFAIYSGAHGVNASLRYAGNNTFSTVAQIVGIISIESVLIGIYLSLLNGRITGSSQMIVTQIVFGFGFLFALAGIVADSQLNAGGTISRELELYLRWGLPIAPGIVAFGALLIHALSPESIRYRKEQEQKRELSELTFAAGMKLERARFEEELSKRGLQIMSQTAVIRELEHIYQSPEFRDAIQRTAIERAPGLFSEVGIQIESTIIPGKPVVAETRPVVAETRPEPEPGLNGSSHSGFLR